MRWSDDGIFLSGRPYGETSVIADIFTRHHGRTLGLIKGGRSRRIRPLLQTANGLRVEWRARLDDQLGVYTAELSEPTAARLLDDRLALSGSMAVAALLQILPERDPHPGLFDAVVRVLREAGTDSFPASLIRFELRFLDELGFGLQLSRCAATGSGEGLVYVSPKSGQAVSREAGKPYSDKLLPLPPFLIHGGPASALDCLEGLRMTGHFLRTHVFDEAHRPLPQAREEFVALLQHKQTDVQGTFVSET
jgi:DNA repair protein RecO (recombination protein O)